MKKGKRSTFPGTNFFLVCPDYLAFTYQYLIGVQDRLGPFFSL